MFPEIFVNPTRARKCHLTRRGVRCDSCMMSGRRLLCHFILHFPPNALQSQCLSRSQTEHFLIKRNGSYFSVKWNIFKSKCWLSKEEYARKRICNGCLEQTENSVTRRHGDNCSAPAGKPCDAAQLFLWWNFKSAPTIKASYILVQGEMVLILQIGHLQWRYFKWGQKLINFLCIWHILRLLK